MADNHKNLGNRQFYTRSHIPRMDKQLTIIRDKAKYNLDANM